MIATIKTSEWASCLIKVNSQVAPTFHMKAHKSAPNRDTYKMPARCV